MEASEEMKPYVSRRRPMDGTVPNFFVRRIAK
jgi:hypothetical protein